MHFIDETTIWVRAGNGGNGCAAFRREAHVPRGGPSGGDGGHGGHVILKADLSVNTLIDYRYRREFRAANGKHGEGCDRYGKKGEDIILRVPCGTVVMDCQHGGLLAELIHDGDEYVAARGGRGGFGNIHFATSTNRTPRRADPGELGEERQLRLELKLIADVGLVGLPNAGKSTLLASISAAKPKIADYPFTTLEPVLGVVDLDQERSFVWADIPGILEGAHRGVGLGHRFLKHIERTRLLIYILDDRHESEAETPWDDFLLLRSELKQYNPELERRPFIVVLNKIDIVPEGRLTAILRQFQSQDVTVFFISAATRKGVRELLNAAWKRVSENCALDVIAAP